MRRIWGVALAVLFVLVGEGLVGRAQAAPPPDRLTALQRGINITGWFRFPGSLDPVALRQWIGDEALADLHRAGFGFVRLAVDPAILGAPGVPEALTQAIQRIEAAGLTVVVSLHPNDWHLETSQGDRDRLFAAWHSLAPLLEPLGPRQTVVELLNEPVFPQDPGGWQVLQHRLLEEVRPMLPQHTVVLTGNDWSSIAGLVAMTPEPDPNVLYTVHFYEPAELTSLAAWRAGLDRAALARLPFPAADEGACRAVGTSTDPDTAGVINYYCAQHWGADQIQVRTDQAATWGRTHQVPVLLGEFGATAMLNSPAREAWLRTVREASERAGMGWALWGYDDVMGLNVPRPPGTHPVLDGAVLGALGLR